MDLNAVFVDGVDHAVEDLTFRRFECDYIKPYVEDHIATRVLDNTLKVIILGIKVVSNDVDDVAKFLGAHADELLVYPLRQKSVQ